jgi:hypothetical protein
MDEESACVQFRQRMTSTTAGHGASDRRTTWCLHRPPSPSASGYLIHNTIRYALISMHIHVHIWACKPSASTNLRSTSITRITNGICSSSTSPAEENVVYRGPGPACNVCHYDRALPHIMSKRSGQFIASASKGGDAQTFLRNTYWNCVIGIFTGARLPGPSDLFKNSETSVRPADLLSNTASTKGQRRGVGTAFVRIKLFPANDSNSRKVCLRPRWRGCQLI